MDEYVKRQDVIDLLYSINYDTVGGTWDNPYTEKLLISSEEFDRMIDKVNDLPYIGVGLEHLGEWIEEDYDYDIPLIRCSECGFEICSLNKYPHCPICGVKMRF